MKYHEINLKLSDGALRAIKELCQVSVLACNDGPLVHAWGKVFEAIDDGKSECEISTKKEREQELQDLVSD